MTQHEDCDDCVYTTCQGLHGDLEVKTYRCPLSGPTLCAVCLKMDELDVSIGEVHKHLADLTRERLALRSRANRHHDPLMQRLPLEIISHVFKIYVDDTNNHSLHNLYEVHGLPPTSVLGSVCKAWRNISRSTPSLWSFLAVYLRYPLRYVPRRAKKAEGHMLLSKMLPLEIFLFGSSTIQLGMVELVDPLIQVLKSYCHRWSHLYLVRLPVDISQRLTNELDDTPLLRKVNVIEGSFSDEDQDYGRLVLRNTPRLTTLCLYHVTISRLDFSWGELANISIHKVSADECLEVLRICERLQTCIFRNVRKVRNRFPLPAGTITHNSLHLLSFGPHHLESATIFLDGIVLPNLQYFTYFSSNARFPMPTMALHSLFDRSQCNLQMISFQNGPSKASRIHDADVLCLLNILHKVADLRIDSDDAESSQIMTDRLLRRLAITHSAGYQGSSGVLLPNFKKFVYSGPLNFSWNQLLDVFLQTSTDAPNSGIVSSAPDTTQRLLKSYRHHFRELTLELQETHDTTSTIPYLDPKVLHGISCLRMAGIICDITYDGEDLIQASMNVHLKRSQLSSSAAKRRIGYDSVLTICQTG